MKIYCILCGCGKSLPLDEESWRLGVVKYVTEDGVVEDTYPEHGDCNIPIPTFVEYEEKTVLSETSIKENEALKEQLKQSKSSELIQKKLNDKEAKNQQEDQRLLAEKAIAESQKVSEADVLEGK